MVDKELLEVVLEVMRLAADLQARCTYVTNRLLLQKAYSPLAVYQVMESGRDLTAEIVKLSAVLPGIKGKG